jgi:hypothetical protein
MMTANMVSKLYVLVVLCCGAAASASAQEITCDQIASMARMVSVRSTGALIAEKQKAGDSYRAQLVFASRAIELRPKDPESAVRLLNLIPQNDAQNTVWMTFGDSLCDHESIAEMKALARLEGGCPTISPKRLCSSQKRCMPMYHMPRLQCRTPTATMLSKCEVSVKLVIKSFKRR